MCPCCLLSVHNEQYVPLRTWYEYVLFKKQVQYYYARSMFENGHILLYSEYLGVQVRRLYYTELVLLMPLYISGLPELG